MSTEAHRLWGWWLGVAGEPVRARVVFLLGCVLGLDTADVGTIGSVAGKLEHALSLNNTALGLLVATPAICSALMTISLRRFGGPDELRAPVMGSACSFGALLRPPAGSRSPLKCCSSSVSG